MKMPLQKNIERPFFPLQFSMKWSVLLATKRCCQRQHISAHGKLLKKASPEIPINELRVIGFILEDFSRSFLASRFLTQGNFKIRKEDQERSARAKNRFLLLRNSFYFWFDLSSELH